MKKSIVLYKSIPAAEKARLEAHFQVTAFDEINETNQADFEKALAKAEGIIGASVNISEKLLENAPHLKAISTISVGYDNFDVAALTKRHIRLMNTPDVLTDTTADTIFMLLLMTARRAVELSHFVRDGKWQKSIGDSLYGIDVHHKTIGIVGMGRIGQAVAKRAHCGFDMKVLYCGNRRNEKAESQYQAQFCSLDELLSQADFVCLTLPLNAQTENLISREKLARMKPQAMLINGARGKIVDEAALIEALQQGQIRAAGLDVFVQEPVDTQSPLLNMDNVVVLPHIGSATVETRLGMVQCAVDNLIAALQDTPPTKNWVNPQAG